MKCPKHKDVEMIMNATGSASGTFYHCWKCCHFDGKFEGQWKVHELLREATNWEQVERHKLSEEYKERIENEKPIMLKTIKYVKKKMSKNKGDVE